MVVRYHLSPGDSSKILGRTVTRVTFVTVAGALVKCRLRAEGLALALQIGTSEASKCHLPASRCDGHRKVLTRARPPRSCYDIGARVQLTHSSRQVNSHEVEDQSTLYSLCHHCVTTVRLCTNTIPSGLPVWATTGKFPDCQGFNNHPGVSFA